MLKWLLAAGVAFSVFSVSWQGLAEQQPGVGSGVKTVADAKRCKRGFIYDEDAKKCRPKPRQPRGSF